jgi:hypothetical protein
MLVHGFWRKPFLGGEEARSCAASAFGGMDAWMNDYGLINNDGYVMTCLAYGMGRTMHQWFGYIQGTY